MSYHARTMANIPLEPLDKERLKENLSHRVKGGFGAFWVAGSRPTAPPPVRPIVLTGGIPDPDSLPTEELLEASNTVLRREGQEALRYGGHQGHPGLREWLAEETRRREGLDVGADNFTITNGISGALINVSETFLNEGDVGLVELPTFPGCHRELHVPHRCARSQNRQVQVQRAQGRLLPDPPLDDGQCQSTQHRARRQDDLDRPQRFRRCTCDGESESDG